MASRTIAASAARRWACHVGLISMLAAPCVWSAAQRTGPGQIHGKVTAKATGAPVVRALANLWSPKESRYHTARTDAEGRFKFVGLNLGSYHLRVRHPDYVEKAHGSSKRHSWTPSIRIQEKTTTHEVNLELTRGGTLSGKLLDPKDGRAQDCYVYAIPLEKDDALPRWWGRQYTRTDPAGQYTISGVAPGKYIMAAIASSTLANEYGMERMIAYHGSAFSPTDAKKVVIETEAEVKGIDIQFRVSGGLSLSGKVIDAESGLPIPRALVVVFHREATMHRLEVYTSPDGDYELNVMAAGPYQVVADARGEGFARDSKWIDIKRGVPPAPVDFELEMGVSFAGTIALDGGESLPRQSRIWAYVRPPADKVENATGNSVYGTGSTTYVQKGAQPERIRLDGDLNFSVEAASPGPVSLHFPNLPRGYYVRRIRHDDFDLTRNAPDFQPGQDVGGITVTLSNQYGTVAGKLTYDTRNRAAAGWRVWTNWHGTDVKSSEPTRTSSRGDFLLKQVPIGRHTLVTSASSTYTLKPTQRLLVRPDRTTTVNGTLTRRTTRQRRRR